MTPQLIDLSLPISTTAPDLLPVRMESTQHGPGGDKVGRRLAWPRHAPLGARLRRLWGHLTGASRITRGDFPDSMFLNNDVVTASVHSGSHMDAPYHFGPRSEGRPARRIDDVPLSWCYGPGVVLDVSHRQAGEEILVSDLEKALDGLGYDLEPGDIVLVRTGMDRLWPSPAYFAGFPGMGAEATAWLLDQGIRTIGIDGPSFDRSYRGMVDDYLSSRDEAALWPAHMLGRKREYVHVERLANLDRLPRPGTFQVACFPVVVEGAGAGWVRAVALVPKEDDGDTHTS